MAAEERCPHGRTVQSRRDNPCPAGRPGCEVPPEPILFRGTTPDGVEVLVTVYGLTIVAGAEVVAAEMATREGEGTWGRWGVPTSLEVTR